MNCHRLECGCGDFPSWIDQLYGRRGVARVNAIMQLTVAEIAAMYMRVHK